MSSKFNRVGLLIGPDSELEAMSIRSTIEYYGYQVETKWVGRPNDVLDCLRGQVFRKQTKVFVLCFHGKAGKFVMPKLASNVYVPGEPRSNLGAEELSQFNLTNKLILSTACTVGKLPLAKVFTSRRNTYIAASGYVDGNAALLFCHSFFFWLKEVADVTDAYERASVINDQTRLFQQFI